MIFRSTLIRLCATWVAVLLLSPAGAQPQTRRAIDTTHGAAGYEGAVVAATQAPEALASTSSPLAAPGLVKTRRLNVGAQPLPVAVEFLADLAGRVVVRPNDISRGYAAPPTVLRI